jgi:serine/threonine-protein kinase
VYAHGLNLVHRDVKPDNILLTKKGVVKLADLGMVKTHDEDMSLTQTGHAVGTPWYMPLEQARNAKEIDGRSDIYALGCTLYAFLTGHPPFVGRTIVDVIKAKEVGTFPPARQSNSDVPERLDLIIAKMTAKSPTYRYQSCDEVTKDLESLGLASETLSFLNEKPVDVEISPEEFEAVGQTRVTATKSRADVDFAESAAPSLDPNIWFVQTKLPDGTSATRKYTTAQLHKMLEEGTMMPTARASHQPTEGFRTLGTYKEFQGVALGTLAKKAADKNTARYRGLYKKIEEKELEKEEKERRDEVDETTMQATRRYWTSILIKALPAIVAVLLLFVLIWYITS